MPQLRAAMPTTRRTEVSLDVLEIAHERMTARWSVPRMHTAALGATVQTQPAGSMLLLSMGAPCLNGAVAANEQGEQGYCGILFNLQGHQRISGATHRTQLAPGDVLLWTSQASCDFEVLAPQRKIQILMPRDIMERLLPDLVPDGGWTRLDGQKPMQMLARTCVETLWRQRTSYSPAELSTALEASLDLLGQCLRPSRTTHRSKEQLFYTVKQYIERHLDDTDLGPASLARRHGVSVRSLHALFAEHKLTVAGTIRERRLESCRRALSSTHSERITELAMRCGFNDAAHFSRLFKSTYGLSPRKYRDASVS